MRGSGQDWLDGGLIGTMRRKDEMETLVTKKPLEAGAQKPRKTSGNHKALITRNLRLAFGEVASEPVPDRFLDLLGKIDTAEGKKQ
jgi:Anti-sigma factor NepR